MVMLCLQDKYPLTKKWFLKTYPEYKESDVSETEAAAEMDKELAAATAALESLSLDDVDFEEEAPADEENAA